MRKFHWKHKNLVLLLLGILVAFFISRNQDLKNFLLRIGDLDYLGAFLTGILFSSTFTFPIGALVLLDLAKDIPIFPLVVLLCLGAVSVDFLIFKLIKNSAAEEISPIYEELEKLGKKNHLRKLFHTKYFGWTLPVFGTFIMMLPIPDELGISILGISNIKPARFLLISLCCHAIGMFLIVTAARII